MADIEAEITYLTTEEGGHTTPRYSGHLSQFYYDGADWDVHHEYPDVDRVFPGEPARTLLTFASPAQQFGRIYPGMVFVIRQGSRIVAHGHVTKILDLADVAQKKKEK